MLINIFFESEYYIDILNKLLISIFNWIHIRRINKCNKKDNKIYIYLNFKFYYKNIENCECL